MPQIWPSRLGFPDMRWPATPAALARWLLVAAAIIWIVVACLGGIRKASIDTGSVAAADRLVQSISGRSSLTGPPASTTSVGYVLVLSALALTTPGTAAGLACYAENRGDCRPGQLVFVFVVQALAAAASLALVYRLALMLSADGVIAALATVLTFLSLRLGEFAGTVRPGVWFACLLLAHLVLLVQVQARARHASLTAAAAGIVLGLAVLFEPMAIVLVPVAAGLLAWGPGRMAEPAAGIARAAAFALGLGAVAALTAGIAAKHGLDLSALPRRVAIQLAQRAAFTGLEPHMWLAAILTSIPVIGDLLLAMLSPDAVRRLAVGSARGSLNFAGSEQIYPEALARAAGSEGGAALLLVRERILGQPLAYLASLPVVVMRGIFAGGGVIALVGLLHLPRLLRYARAEGRLGQHLRVVVPAAALFLANALFSGNEFWLNPLLPVIYAYAIVYVAGGW